ncbi:hypothetical protein AB0I10_12085 [Streptomyces sp. NPDC050636]|uniref:hypothetical protein n=1 Tax=Streptomyces sp. NPDC050636 TaxID=3154510 RepID=UPI00343CF991
MGIIIPVIGILVTLLVSGRDAPADESRTTDSAPTGSPTAKSDEETSTAETSKIMFGPETIEARTSAYGQDIELDASKPLIEESIKGADLNMISAADGTAATAKLLGPLAAHNLAPLPSSSSQATEAECAKSLQKNATMQVDGLVKGRRLCVQTDEGRIAYVRVVSAPSGAHAIKIAVTVWDLPS